MKKKLIEVNNLRTYFYTEAGTAKAVDGINFDIFEGEVLGIVGESGSGKSVSSLSINRLIPNPPGEIVDGSIKFKGTNLLNLSYEEMKKYRGKEIAMIFQEPMTSLNPVTKIKIQMNSNADVYGIQFDMIYNADEITINDISYMIRDVVGFCGEIVFG